MKTFNYIFLIILLLGITISVFADEVNINDAKRVAVNHYFEKNNSYVANLDYSDILIDQSFIKESSGMPVLYIFHFHSGGFSIVSAEDKVWPVIGYSFNGTFPTNLSANSNYGQFLQEYINEIEYVRTEKISCANEIQLIWDHLLNSSVEELIKNKDEKNVSPMLSSLWHQGSPYNILCPEDPTGNGGHTVTGCGATSMSQIMHYWRYPQTGTGSNSYYANPYGIQTANFGETTYNWGEMQNSIDNNNPFPIATLNYHAGVAIDMNYGPDGSGAQPDVVDDALRNYFKYDDAIYLDRSNFSTLNWTNMIKDQIDLGQPVLYMGYNDDGGGHGFVCDGYQENDFHFNFGWGGSANGYYTLNDIYGFHVNQKCVKDIYPTEPDYPYFAEGVKTISGFSGSLTDGSGPVEDYLNNTSASWLFDPQSETDSVTSITFNFYMFETAVNDVLTIYDGSTEDAPVIGTYSGNEIPGTFTSNGNQVLITFGTNSNETSKGWYLEYFCNFPDYCMGLTTFTESTGTFSDGSAAFNYSNNSTCMYKIEPEWGNNITLFFNSFETEEGIDKVKVFDGNTPIGVFSGNEIPEPVTAYSGSMFITFSTNSNTTFNGWEVYYEVDNVGIQTTSIQEQFNLLPNPARDKVKVSFTNYSESEFSIEIISVLGELVLTESFSSNENIVSKTINTSQIQKGAYIIRMKSEKRMITKRLVIQ